MEAQAEVYFQPAPEDKVFEWSLVLTARGIPHWVERAEDGLRLLVPRRHQKRALRELRLYDMENRPRKARAHEDLPGAKSVFWTIVVITALECLTFHPALAPWLKRYGMGDARAILSGKWWLTITALTLHADPAHLLGNMLFGGLFVALVRASWPAGFTWFSVILTGALGNYLNCLLRRDFFFLGASTAVFGALGILCALRWRMADRRAALLSLGAGFALLGLLGTGGERTDPLAHLLGFLVGLLWGLFWAKRIEKVEPYDLWFKVLAVALPVVAWFKALYPFSFLARHSIFNY